MCIFIQHRCLLVCFASLYTAFSAPVKRLAGHYSIKQSCGHIEQIYCENTLTFKQFPPSRLWMIKRSKADLLFPSLKRQPLYKKVSCVSICGRRSYWRRICLVKVIHFICSTVIFIEIITRVLRCTSIGNYIFNVCAFFYFEYVSEGLIFKWDSKFCWWCGCCWGM